MPHAVLLRLGLAASVAGLLTGGLPAGADTAPVTTVGSPSVPGTAKGFRLVGHTDLGGRAMNSPLAVAGRCAYVGDRSYALHPRRNAGIAVVDISRPAAPRQVNLIPARPDSTQRELRADAGLGLLVVEDYAPYAGSDLTGGDAYSGNDIQVYDIAADCMKPRLLSTYDFGVRAPHEFFLWKDPKHPGRVLAYVTSTIYGPDLTVLDLSDPTKPALKTVYELPHELAAGPADAAKSMQPAGYVHSIAVSDDGTRAYVGNWDYGTYVADTSGLSDPTGVPVIRPLGTSVLDYGANVHGTVPVPTRPYGVMVQEEYAAAGRGCPFGWLRMADLTDPAAPRLAGGYRIPENDCDRAQAANGTFTAHNQTAFPHVALLTYYSGGLRAVDISNPARPVEGGVFVPKADPAFSPPESDARLFFTGSKVTPRVGAMWSYPVVQDGLVYAVDIDLGLYVLRYTGPHAAEVAAASFVEGNSAPSRFSRRAPVIRRTAAVAAAVARLRAPTKVTDRVLTLLPNGHRAQFVC